MVRPEGVEPPAFWFVAKRSIQLSYGRTLQKRQPFNDIRICLSNQAARNKAKTGAPGGIGTSDLSFEAEVYLCFQ